VADSRLTLERVRIARGETAFYISLDIAEHRGVQVIFVVTLFNTVRVHSALNIILYE